MIKTLNKLLTEANFHHRKGTYGKFTINSYKMGIRLLLLTLLFNSVVDDSTKKNEQSKRIKLQIANKRAKLTCNIEHIVLYVTYILRKSLKSHSKNTVKFSIFAEYKDISINYISV